MGLFWNKPPTGALPQGLAVYAIGDIHGRSDLLDRLLGLIRRDIARWRGPAKLVFLGDYVDRGPDSRGVIDMLIGVYRDADAHFLRGNHDQAMLDFLGAASTFPMWRDFGGKETLRSYGVSPPVSEDPTVLFGARNQLAAVLPATHRKFLQETKMSVTIGDYFFTHAGAKPGVPLERQSARDLMWIRDEFLASDSDFGKIVVHGHTPARKPNWNSNRIGIDTEAYASGTLTAAVFQGSTCRFIQT